MRGAVTLGIVAAAVAGLAAGRASSAEGRVPAGAAALVAAYPEHLAGFEDGAVVWRDGARTGWDDGEAGKPLERMLASPDLEDQMSTPYPRDHSRAPGVDEDPGRVRHPELFGRMYGASPREVRARLEPVRWMPRTRGQRLWVTRTNGVSARLAAASEEMDRLPLAARRVMARAAGGFSWRRVAGTDRLSAHAYGVAVDVGMQRADYWRWRAPRATPIPYRNRIPLAAVEIMERHGFIWGGAWYHYDTMHFEYRPELLGQVSGASPIQAASSPSAVEASR